MPRIEHLASFCKIIELQSFSAAAKEMGVSQSALSQQMKALEEGYKTQLLHRKGNKIKPTENGRHIYNYAQEMVALYERSVREVDKHSNNLEGELLVGASSGPAEFPVPLLLGMYKQAHPNISIILKAADSADVIDRILHQSLEIGFVGMEQRDSHLTFKPFFEDYMILVVSPDHPYASKKSINFEEFIEIPIIIQQRGAGITESFIALLNAQGIDLKDLNIVMEMGLQDSAKAAAMAGFGGAIISKLGGVSELKNRELIEVTIEDVNLCRPQYLCFNHRVPLSNLASNFLAFAEEQKNDLIQKHLPQN
jgi:DNA-binding transcriptional LysR family regulator